VTRTPRPPSQPIPPAAPGGGGAIAALTFPEPRSLAELAARFGGVVDPGARAREVTGIAPIASAGAPCLAPFLDRRYAAAARRSEAAILVAEDLQGMASEGARWVHPNAAYALARLLEELSPSPPQDERARALIEPGARVDPSASIGAFAVIRSGATIGPGTRVEPHAVIYGGVVLGARVHVGAGAVVGRPGFGWTTAPDEGRPVRVPQLGGVHVEDDAELGPLVTVDAGTLEPTVIGRAAKLDAHVHVGHNAVIGPFSFVAAQSGFAGSASIGAGVLVGGQAGFADHVHVGDGAKVGAKAGVIGDIAAGATVAGYPAVDRARWLRAVAHALKGPRRKGV
jgi:UDP-3-O-[3-hydroxymyristoyl] glucosamine N-acyltransferase